MANFLDQLLRGGTPQRPAAYPREGNIEDDFAMMADAGWFNAPQSNQAVTQFDPMATDSRLGNAPQVEKEKNQLNTLFQGAIFAGDLEKAARLAVTAEQQALLGVAYGDRMSRQAGQQPTGMADYGRMQQATAMQSRAEEDRRMKMAEMKSRIGKTNAETRNLQFKDPTATDWAMGSNGMYNKRTGEVRPMANQKGSVGQQAVDREFAKDYADYQASGGYADVEKQLNQLNQVSKDLGKDGNNYTGSIRGLLPDRLRAITNPDSVAAKEKVQEVAQRNLRLVLGAQFTQVEGERLINRAYNDQMEPKENKRRVDALLKQIKKAAQVKDDAARYFEANGTLNGWSGKLPTLSDFDSAMDSPAEAPKANDATQSSGGWKVRKL